MTELSRDRTHNLQCASLAPYPSALCYMAPTMYLLFLPYIFNFLYICPREEEAKAEPDPSPNSNPTIACELLAHVPKVQDPGHYWSLVPKVQDQGQL